ncbi:hypothetical protein BDR22DRAFT_819442 [Usnea florida]
MKLDTFVLPLSVLSTLVAALPAPKPDAAVEVGEAKGHDHKARFVPSIIPYKDYSEDEEVDSEHEKIKARFVPSIIPYKDYSEDEEYKDYSEDEEEVEPKHEKVKARFVPSIIPYKDYSEDQDEEPKRNEDAGIHLRMFRLQATECTVAVHVPVTQKGSMIWQQGFAYFDRSWWDVVETDPVR